MIGDYTTIRRNKMPQSLKFYAREWNVQQSLSYNDADPKVAEEFESGKFSRQLMYTQEEVTNLLHDKWMDTIHEMQRAWEVKRKAVYDFIDAIESQTDDWDMLCDCDMDGKDPSDDKYGHSVDCMTMNARHDVEQLLKKFEGER